MSLETLIHSLGLSLYAQEAMNGMHLLHVDRFILLTMRSLRISTDPRFG